MSKQKTSFTLSADTIRLLKLLAEKNDRSASNMIEILIKEAMISAERVKEVFCFDNYYLLCGINTVSLW